MTQTLEFLAAPLAMCLVLAGMHCYLGLHVLARGVIFVDLSLAQVASFGATVALLWDPEHGTHHGYAVALVATFLAAGLFALARRYERKFPQEAVIGITYALASAAVVLVVERLSHGAEHLKDALVGQILWVSWRDVFSTMAIYAAVGLVHWIFRRQLLQASHHPTPGGAKPHWVWDFLFYALFGVVITSSTHVAGVLQVFAYLIVPALLGTLFFKTMGGQLLFGWMFSALLSLAGIGLSYVWDLPVGALLVVLFTVCPLLYLLLQPVIAVAKR